MICPTTTSQGLSLILLVTWSASNLCKSLALVRFVLKSRVVVGHTWENKLLHGKDSWLAVHLLRRQSEYWRYNLGVAGTCKIISWMARYPQLCRSSRICKICMIWTWKSYGLGWPVWGCRKYFYNVSLYLIRCAANAYTVLLQGCFKQSIIRLHSTRPQSQKLQVRLIPVPFFSMVW